MPFIDKLTIKHRRLAIAYAGLSMLLLLVQPLYASPSITASVNVVQAHMSLSQLDRYPAPAIKQGYRLAQADNFISLREAIVSAKRRFPGKVLSAKRSLNRKGDVVYRIKIISNSSEIRTITISAKR